MSDVTKCVGVKQISGFFCLVRLSVRLISYCFDIILTVCLTGITPVRIILGIHTSEITKKITEMAVRIT